MKKRSWTPLEVREVFHLEFLRWFSRTIPAELYAIKGGVNLRLFFQSFRYSEDMDIDVRTVGVARLSRSVMAILDARSFHDHMRSFSIDRIILSNLAVAKQTQTTQRFKVHLVTTSGEDLFTKIEFSRRVWAGEAIVAPVSDTILRAYQLTPLVVPHYDWYSAVLQKVAALASRATVQARDVFDLFLLSSQHEPSMQRHTIPSQVIMKKAEERLFSIGFVQFRDAVVSYLSPEDQDVYGQTAMWEDVQLKTARFLEELGGGRHV